MHEPSSNHRQKSSIVIKVIVPFALLIVGVLIVFQTNGVPKTSKVDGMSDEVYVQLIEHYFFAIALKEASEREHPNFSWIQEHDKYADAMAYFEASDEPITPFDVFPNPLIYEFEQNEGAYSEVERTYIIKVRDFSSYFVQNNEDIFQKYQTEIKDGLHIKESYNPFD